MARPRLQLDETAIAQAYTDGATILGLATEHGVDRDLEEAEQILTYRRQHPALQKSTTPTTTEETTRP